MRILITEEALHTGSGHWSSYIGDIASGLRDLGDSVDVAAHRDASEAVLKRVGGIPWLSKNCWIDLSSQGAVGGIRHNLTFKKELGEWINSHASYDWICALTMRLQHLLAFALLARSSCIPQQTRFFLLFVQGFGSYACYGKPPVFKNNPSTILARFCFWLMGPAVHSGRVVLAAETKGMQDELQRFTGLPVQLAPHPVQFSGQPKPSTLDFDGTCSPASGATPERLPEAVFRVVSRNLVRPSTQPITITCPGFARHEKGTDLFQDAIRILLSRPDAGRFHFVLQWPEPFAMPDGSMQGPGADLITDPRVEFLNRNLNTDEYEALLSRTELIILPYRKNSYHHRVSRVAIEAAGHGIPILFTKGTWSEEVAEIAGCGVPIWGESAKELSASILQAAEKYTELKKGAEAGAAQVMGYHSVQTFREILKRRIFHSDTNI